MNVADVAKMLTLNGELEITRSSSQLMRKSEGSFSLLNQVLKVRMNGKDVMDCKISDLAKIIDEEKMLTSNCVTVWTRKGGVYSITPMLEQLSAMREIQREMTRIFRSQRRHDSENLDEPSTSGVNGNLRRKRKVPEAKDVEEVDQRKKRSNALVFQTLEDVDANGSEPVTRRASRMKARPGNAFSDRRKDASTLSSFRRGEKARVAGLSGTSSMGSTVYGKDKEKQTVQANSAKKSTKEVVHLVSDDEGGSSTKRVGGRAGEVQRLKTTVLHSNVPAGKSKAEDIAAAMDIIDNKKVTNGLKRSSVMRNREEWMPKEVSSSVFYGPSIRATRSVTRKLLPPPVQMELTGPANVGKEEKRGDRRLEATKQETTVDRPPSGKSREEEDIWEEVRGMKNLGNTCYANAVFQSILSLQVFISLLRTAEKRNHVLREKLFYSNLMSILKDEKTGSLDEEVTAVSPRKALEAFAARTRRFTEKDQEDAQEFLLLVLSLLEEEVTQAELGSPPKHAIDADPVTKVFSCVVQRTFTCKSCRFRGGPRYELHKDLSLDLVVPPEVVVGHKPSLQTALRDYFATEDITRTCEKCSHPVSTRESSIAMLPQVLILHLKRAQNGLDGAHVKSNHRVKIPMYLNLNKFAEGALGPDIFLKPGYNDEHTPDKNSMSSDEEQAVLSEPDSPQPFGSQNYADESSDLQRAIQNSLRDIGANGSDAVRTEELRNVESTSTQKGSEQFKGLESDADNREAFLAANGVQLGAADRLEIPNTGAGDERTAAADTVNSTGEIGGSANDDVGAAVGQKVDSKRPSGEGALVEQEVLSTGRTENVYNEDLTRRVVAGAGVEERKEGAAAWPPTEMEPVDDANDSEHRRGGILSSQAFDACKFVENVYRQGKEDFERKVSARYRLQCIIRHQGVSATSGHFVADIR